MPKSAATRAATTWLQTGHAPEERKREVAIALALLSGRVPLSPAVFDDRRPDTDVLLATLLRAEVQSMWDLVALIRDHCGDRACSKQAKKILFRARQRGLWKEERAPARAAVDLSARADPPPSLCSTPDDSGRQVALHGGRDAQGAYSLVGVIDEEDGLITVYRFENPSRRRLQGLADELMRSYPRLVVEVPAAFAAARLRWGLDRADERSLWIDGDVATARRLLQGVTGIETVGAALDPADQGRLDELAELGAELFADPLFALWLEPCALGAAGLEDFGFEEVPTRAGVVAYFDAAHRASFATRFEISAYLLSRVGRRREALAAIATARLLRDPNRHAADIPFLRAGISLEHPE